MTLCISHLHWEAPLNGLHSRLTVNCSGSHSFVQLFNSIVTQKLPYLVYKLETFLLTNQLTPHPPVVSERHLIKTPAVSITSNAATLGAHFTDVLGTVHDVASSVGLGITLYSVLIWHFKCCQMAVHQPFRFHVVKCCIFCSIFSHFPSLNCNTACLSLKKTYNNDLRPLLSRTKFLSKSAKSEIRSLSKTRVPRFPVKPWHRHWPDPL